MGRKRREKKEFVTEAIFEWEISQFLPQPLSHEAPTAAISNMKIQSNLTGASQVASNMFSEQADAEVSCLFPVLYSFETLTESVIYT